MIKRIAFDLDNTLIRNDYQFPIEKPRSNFLLKLFGLEQLRQGTKAIFEYCRSKRIETWIYTSSYRSHQLIRLNFWLSGIILDGIVTQETHNKIVKIKSVKYPPKFNTD